MMGGGGVVRAVGVGEDIHGTRGSERGGGGER